MVQRTTFTLNDALCAVAADAYVAVSFVFALQIGFCLLFLRFTLIWSTAFVPRSLSASFFGFP